MASELTQTMNQSLSLAWDGIAGSDVSSELTSSYEQLLEGILVAMGGATLDDLYYEDTEIIEAILNQADAGNTLTALSTSRVELWAAIVNALGGSGSHLIHSEDELVAMFATLVENGLPGGSGSLMVSRYINSNSFQTHVLGVGVRTLTGSLYIDADVFYAHVLTGDALAPGEVVLMWATTSSDTTPNFQVDLPSGNGAPLDAEAGDDLVLQYSTDPATTWNAYLTRTLDAGDIVAVQIDVGGVTPLSDGDYLFRGRLVRGAHPAPWSASEAVTIAASSTAGEMFGFPFPITKAA